MMPVAYGERIARVEVEVQELKREFQEHKKEVNDKLKTMDGKLDDLLALRNKGAGIVWLLSGAGVSGIIAILSQVFHWFRS